MRSVLMLFFFFIPAIAFAAEDVDFLKPSITEIHTSLVCPKPDACQEVFLIQGRNFENANGIGAVKIGDDWAEIIKWTPTSIVAITGQENHGRQPAVTVDTSLHRPTLITEDLVLKTMFEQSVQVAIDSIKIAEDGSRYITAGPFYGNPERVYYRDSYWTSGMILLMEPSIIRDQILLLARGIEPNGSVPSAIPVNPTDPKIPLWVDHDDSGPYFIMLVRDYLAWTGDTDLLDEQVNDKTIFTHMEDILTYLTTKDLDGDLLIEKPANRALNDWADSIPREGEVLYNQALYYKGLRDMVEVAQVNHQPSHAKAFHRHSLLLRFQINEQLWNEKKGYYFERCDQNGCIDRLTNDSSVAALFEVIDPEKRERFFQSLRLLEPRNNNQLAYGDWGVSNVFPFYEGSKYYYYQNGTDWPFLDGINAGARLKFHDEDWYYPMTQWWIWWNASGREGVLPEFVSPIDEHPGLSQAWSVNPVFSFVRYGLGLDPDINGAYEFKDSPAGPLEIQNFFLRGQRIQHVFSASKI